MNRQNKYPDTSTFHYYNANPKNRITEDCWLRAICTGLQESYNTVLKDLCEVQLETGYELSCDRAVEIYLKKKGWKKMKQPRKSDNTKYTGKEFCKELMRYDSVIDSGNDMHHVIANIGGHHMVAIISGVVYDIWDSTDGCIGNYYVKE